jgi:hypothetical protein
VGRIVGQIVDDAVSTATDWLQVDRSGMTVTAVNFPTGGDVLKSGGNPVLHTGNMALRVVTAWLADLAVTTGKIADLAVTTGKIAANAITLDKLELPPRRKGGSPSDWSVAGTTNYTPSSMRVQFGVGTVTIANGASSGNVTIALPTTSVVLPVVFVTPVTELRLATFSSFAPIMINTPLASVTTTSFVVNARTTLTGDTASGAQSFVFNWIAFGS